MNSQQLDGHSLDSLETLSLVCGDFHGLDELLGRNDSRGSPEELERCEPVERRGFLWRRLAATCLRCSVTARFQPCWARRFG
jgi:hypothetical protein